MLQVHNITQQSLQQDNILQISILLLQSQWSHNIKYKIPYLVILYLHIDQRLLTSTIPKFLLLWTWSTIPKSKHYSVRIISFPYFELNLSTIPAI